MLRQSLRSLQQTAPGIELIVIDNGPACQSEWLATQPITTCLHPPRNLGIAGSRNYGVPHAHGAYLAFVDTDLLYFPGWLHRALEIFDKYPHEKLIVAPPFSSPMRRSGMFLGKLDQYDTYSLASGQCQIFRRSDFDLLGLWPEINGGKGPKEDARHARWATRRGYRYIRDPHWWIEHLGEGIPSCNHRFGVEEPGYLRPLLTSSHHDRVRRLENTKREFIRQHADGRRVLIETGTREGDTVAYLLYDFDRIHTVELDPVVQAQAHARFWDVPHVTCWGGDSRDVLPKILADLDQPAVFWLDAHYFGTAEEGRRINLPILDEVRAISTQPHDHLVLIDDAKVFLDWPHRTAEFPTLNQITATLQAGHPAWQVCVENNIILARKGHLGE